MPETSTPVTPIAPHRIVITGEQALQYDAALIKIANSDAAIGAKHSYAAGKLARKVQRVAEATRKEIKRIKAAKMDDAEATAAYEAALAEVWHLEGCVPLVISRYLADGVTLEPSNAGLLGLLEDSPFVADEAPVAPVAPETPTAPVPPAE